MLKKDPFNEESVTIEDSKVFLWLGRAGSPNSSKIDVTMAFNIGMAIGSKEYEKILTKRIDC